MLKATEYRVEYNIGLDIKAGFKTLAEAEEWAHHNTIDGKVEAVYLVDDIIEDEGR